MFKSYIKIILRNLVKHKVNSLVNIFGLAIGLACAILIMLYVGEELSFDSFHPDADRIYRVVLSYQRDGTTHWANTPAPLKTALQTEYPELKTITRVGGINGQMVVIYKHKQIRNQRVQRVDNNFLQIFSLPLSRGHSDTVLKDIKSAVISRKLAAILFPDENPMGKTLKIGNISKQQDYQVTGVLKDIPANSRFQMDVLTPFRENYARGNEGNVSWGALNYSTYILLPKTFIRSRLESGSRRFWQKYRGKEIGGEMDLHLQPLKKIHLNLSPGYLLPTDRKSSHIYIFLAVALLILVIASINYMNLAIGRYMEREREVGMRKVLGARRGQLVGQFLGESVVMTVMAFMLALLLAELFLPLFNQYTGKSLALIALANPKYLLTFIFLSLFVGFAAGSFPAFYISGLPLFTVIKGPIGSYRPGSGMVLKKILVVLQFAISLVFLASTAIIHQQMNYIQNRELGYDSEQIVVVPIYQLGVKARYQLYKTEILRYQGVVSVSAANYLPSKQSYFQNIYLEQEDKEKMHYISWIPVDPDFINTMGITLKSGKDFSKEQLTMAGSRYILNETAVNKLNWSQPLQKRLKIIDWGPVIGVVKDFHFKSLHYPVQPMALCVYPDAFEYLLVRIQNNGTAATIQVLKKKWDRIYPQVPFSYTFFNDHFERVYQREMRLGHTFNLISGLAILIACLGLFALFSFTTGRRTKEIGIRKVLGCSVPGIVFMLTRELIYAILAACLVAWPVTWFIMSKWLQNFAFRTGIDIAVFVLAGCFCLVLALGTIAFQAIKKATSDPVETLRYE